MQRQAGGGRGGGVGACIQGAVGEPRGGQAGSWRGIKDSNTQSE